MAYIIPNVGDYGVFSITYPFQETMSGDIPYTCRSVRSMTEFQAAGTDVFNEIYAPAGLARPAYELDLRQGIPIATMEPAGGGTLLRIPCRYFQGVPMNNGVYYHDLVAAVGLGAVMTSMDLGPIKRVINDAVYEALGVTPTIEFNQNSRPRLLSFEESAVGELSRDARRSLYKSNLGRYNQVVALYEAEREKVRVLEEYIKTKL